MVYRIIGKVNGEGQGFVLGFTKDDKKTRIVYRLKERGLNWKTNELEIVRCVNKK
jgi:hypothetical protein